MTKYFTSTFMALFIVFIAMENAYANVLFHHASARATPPNAVNSAIFATIINNSKTAAEIIAVNCDAAKTVELRDFIESKEIAQIHSPNHMIRIPPKSQIELKPGKLHLVLLDLNKPLIEGEEIQLSLTFADRHVQIVSIPIKKAIKPMEIKH